MIIIIMIIIIIVIIIILTILNTTSIQHLSEEVVHQIIGEAVEVEKAFICDALPVSLIGMNSDLMREYIEYCADRYGRTDIFFYNFVLIHFSVIF